MIRCCQLITLYSYKVFSSILLFKVEHTTKYFNLLCSRNFFDHSLSTEKINGKQRNLKYEKRYRIN